MMLTTQRTVPFLDLTQQHSAIRAELQAALMEVLDSGQFALGPAVERFEANFAAYAGAHHAVGVNSGTSALHLALCALGVGPGDEVIVPAYTFVAPVSTVVYCGARPVMVDIEADTFTIDVERLEAAITPRTKAIIPVHLYGQMAGMDVIMELAEKHGIAVVEDAAQAHGAHFKGAPAGTLGNFGCFSFYPTKNLGSAGEGGGIITDDAKAAAHLRILRNWGSEVRYQHNYLGFNYRMEGFQGAVLDVKLKYLKDWTVGRRRVAELYLERLRGLDGLDLPEVAADRDHVWHVFSILVDNRDDVKSGLAERGIQSAIYYPIPLHRQPCFADLGYQEGDFPVAEACARRQLALPIFPEIADEDVVYVADCLRALVSGEPATARP